jgi:hypothetical protein
MLFIGSFFFAPLRLAVNKKEINGNSFYISKLNE